MDIEELFVETTVRLEHMYVLAMAQPDEAPHELIDQVEMDFSDVLGLFDEFKELPPNYFEDTTHFFEKLQEYGKRGFLAKFATPYKTFISESCCSFSWGYYTTAWFYDEKLEDLAQKAVNWAKDHELKTGIKK